MCGIYATVMSWKNAQIKSPLRFCSDSDNYPGLTVHAWFLILCREAGILLVVALLPTLLWAVVTPSPVRWSPHTLLPGEVQLDELLKSQEQILWIDARSEEEYLQGHIPGAVLLNEERWEALFVELMKSGKWEPGKKVVVYCSSLSCQSSHLVAERLRKQSGIPNVFVLKGGWEAWKKHFGR